MYKLSRLGRFFIAVAMVAFGALHFVYLDFVTRVTPKLPAWIPARTFLACVFGALLLSAGVAIMLEKAARPVALLLGAIIFSSFALLHLPPVITTPLLPFKGGLWTAAGKALALSGGSFLVAGALPVKLDSPANALAKALRALARFIPLGRFFLAAFLILSGIEHFIYVELVTRLVPSWIPGGVFWTYFAGVALIAGGAGMCIPLTLRPAAALTGLMIFTWAVILHIPRAVTMTTMRDPNEATAVFEALAFSGVAFMVAAAPMKTDPMVFEK
jgi:uncharacterized membrane protein